MSAIAMPHVSAADMEPNPWLQWFVRIPDVRKPASGLTVGRRQESVHQSSAEDLNNGDPPPQILWGEES